MGRPKGSKNKKSAPPEQESPAQTITVPEAGTYPVEINDPEPVSVPKGARQDALPGMEDRAITELNEAAIRYDEIKRERAKLKLQEDAALDEVAALMRAQKRNHYQFRNIIIDLEQEEKTSVKVKAETVDSDDVPAGTGYSDVPAEVATLPSDVPDAPDFEDMEDLESELDEEEVIG
jgi:hypothetical protein